MGNWSIYIQGVGCHHNGKPDIDADLAAKAFVEALQKQGHTIESATFTHGARDNLLNSNGDSLFPQAVKALDLPHGETIIGLTIRTMRNRLSRTNVIDELAGWGVNVRNQDGTPFNEDDLLKSVLDAYEKFDQVTRNNIVELLGGVRCVNVAKSILTLRESNAPQENRP